MKDPLKTVKMINEQPLEIKKELRIRELIRVNNIMGTVNSDGIEGELPGKYSVWFKTPKEAKEYENALNDDKTVLVTLKEIGARWSVIDSEIRTPNAEIKESSLSEQKKESEAFADY